MTSNILIYKLLFYVPVLPFDIFLDRKRRSYFLRNLNSNSGESIPNPKIVDDAAVALASCEEELERELLISTS